MFAAVEGYWRAFHAHNYGSLLHLHPIFELLAPVVCATIHLHLFFAADPSLSFDSFQTFPVLSSVIVVAKSGSQRRQLLPQPNLPARFESPHTATPGLVAFILQAAQRPKTANTAQYFS